MLICVLTLNLVPQVSQDLEVNSEISFSSTHLSRL